ncbi:unnamed protein product [Brachionus calyciflorus]|uniref:RING-type E3 ubiquitin transferase n=1 Tax=Brachionus calyciflorus TaxID=104777 RepID=A0A813WTN5_9BILA|nr:unnamed protein product [Brachionus calyciflorus]
MDKQNECKLFKGFYRTLSKATIKTRQQQFKKSFSSTSLLLRTPQTELIGCRVVRGPNWKWGKQDGGEGHVGTIRNFESFEEVVVIWDNGTGANYRCSGEFDIRILEPSPCGLYHESIKCNECGKDPLYGIRWICADCLANEKKNINLCSQCYNNDKHLVKHCFYRILTQTSEKVLVKSRRKSKKISYKGIYPGARVIRGLDWIWDNQDKSETNSKGTVLLIKNWNIKSPLSSAYIKWDNGNENLYRLGYQGMIDLKSKIDAKGGYYYPEHLPVLGERTIIKKITKNTNDSHLKDHGLEEIHSNLKSKNSSTRSSVENLKMSSNPSLYENGGINLNPHVAETCKLFKINDHVNIDLEFEVFQSLQVGHGGWSEDMFECLGNTGVITRIDSDNDFEVTFPSGNKWTLNPTVLTLASDIPQAFIKPNTLNLSTNPEIILNNTTDFLSTPSNIYDINPNLIDLFSNNLSDKHTSDINLNTGLNDGNYIKQMDLDADKTKEVINKIETFDEQVDKTIRKNSENDVKIENSEKTPSCDNDILKNIENTVDSKNKSEQNIYEDLLNASANGDKETCENILKIQEIEINKLISGHTCLQAACHNGNIDIVKMLLKRRARIEIEASDKDGDRAIHHSAYGNQSKIIEILYEHVTDKKKFLNSRNKKFQSALHIAVCKQHVDSVKILIELGANLNLQDCNGDTPLHDSILTQNDNILILLLNANADLTVLNNFDFNPIQYAALKGNTK